MIIPFKKGRKNFRVCEKCEKRYTTKVDRKTCKVCCLKDQTKANRRHFRPCAECGKFYTAGPRIKRCHECVSKDPRQPGKRRTNFRQCFNCPEKRVTLSARNALCPVCVKGRRRLVFTGTRKNFRKCYTCNDYSHSKESGWCQSCNVLSKEVCRSFFDSEGRLLY